MSLRNIEVQYVGDTLYLPPLEREVRHIIVRNEDVKDWEHFEPKRTCHVEHMPKNKELRMASWIECSECGGELPVLTTANYCPNCGARVVSE